MQLELNPEVVTDISSLPDDAAKRAAIQAIADVRLGRRVGVELEYRADTGDPRDCRKVYFDAPYRNERPRFRLVYHVIDENRVEVIRAEVIAMGERNNLAAYKTASERLGRSPKTRETP